MTCPFTLLPCLTSLASVSSAITKTHGKSPTVVTAGNPARLRPEQRPRVTPFHRRGNRYRKRPGRSGVPPPCTPSQAQPRPRPSWVLKRYLLTELMNR